MSYPTASGMPNHSGSYIPTLYGTMLLVEYYIQTIFSDICTTEHEGQISKVGDTLRIRTLPSEGESRDYVKGMDMEYDDDEGGYIDLLINRGVYWGLKFNELDKRQMDIKYVEKWAAHRAHKQKIKIDNTVLANVYGDASPYNRGLTAGKKSGSFNFGATGSPLALSKSNIMDTIIDCGTACDEIDMPEDNRYLVLAPWACGMLKKSDLKDASMTGDGQSVARNGRLGMIDRFTIYRSNNLTDTTDGAYNATNMIFGHKEAIAFASQMLITETLKNPKDIGDLMRSVQAYGFLVQKPEGLGHIYARPAAA